MFTFDMLFSLDFSIGLKDLNFSIHFVLFIEKKIVLAVSWDRALNIFAVGE